jgi:hypothetical protein
MVSRRRFGSDTLKLQQLLTSIRKEMLVVASWAKNVTGHPDGRYCRNDNKHWNYFIKQPCSKGFARAFTVIKADFHYFGVRDSFGYLKKAKVGQTSEGTVNAPFLLILLLCVMFAMGFDSFTWWVGILIPDTQNWLASWFHLCWLYLSIILHGFFFYLRVYCEALLCLFENMQLRDSLPLLETMI